MTYRRWSTVGRRWSTVGRAAARVTTLLAVALAVLTVGAPAHAADEATGLDVRVRSDDPLRPTITLTNQGSALCLVSTTTYGTTTLTQVEQGGAEVSGILTDVLFPDGLEPLITKALRPLDPGASIELVIPVIKAGPTDHMLEVITWSPELGPLATLYPVAAGQPLHLAAVYSVPVPVEADPGVCAVGTSAAGSASAESGWLRWVVVGWGAVLVLLVALVLMVWVRRRRRTKAGKAPQVTAGAAGLLLLATLAVAATVQPRPAFATIDFDNDKVKKAYDGCVSTFSMAGGDPAKIFPTLDDPKNKVRIDTPAKAGDSHTIKVSGTETITFWDPDDLSAYEGEPDNFRDPCSVLYHELFHAYEILNNTIDYNTCVTAADGNTGIRISEVKATKAQNLLRNKLGLPERKKYGGKPLPKGECLPANQPPAGKSCSGQGCGDSNGDPHLATFDGARYDFQAVGEFVATRDPAGGFEIQVRQVPLLNTRVASVNAAVAMDVAGTTVELGEDDGRLRLLVNRTPTVLQPTSLAGGGRLEPTDKSGASITWPDGSVATVTRVGRWMIHLTVEPAAARAGHLEGILGDFDGNQDNDLRPRGGQPISQPPAFEALYPGFADSWRIDAAASLFTYPAGASTDTYTDRTFPDRPVSADQLANRAWAEAVCRRFGVTDPVVLAGCIVDVGLSGQPDFALAAAASQAFVTGLSVDGPAVLLRITTPGGTIRLSFDGTAGQKVFVQVTSTTLPNECAVLKLDDPASKHLASGCLINGSGAIDSTLLPTSGRYTIEIDPNSDATGELVVRVVTVSDQQATLVPNGPELVAKIATPGAVARFTFAGTADQKIFVDATEATLPNECGVLWLRAADGSSVASGCLINGAGYVDRAVLPATGTYTVEVDPRDDVTGQVKLRLVAATDQVAAVSLNGPTITATIGQSGAVARFTFAGTAGQRIFVDVLSSTVPNSCGVVQLLTATGEHIVSGCIINGTGKLYADGAVLPATGSYAIVIDPNGPAVGVATLTLHT